MNHIRSSTRIAGGICALFLAFAPVISFARTDLSLSGWIPYWRDSEGIASARDHLDAIDTLHPFSISVRDDGSLTELSDLSERKWTRLFKSARSEDVEIIPTVMWSNGGAIHTILSNEDLREDHIEEIVDFVEDGNFDGIDIDYESKWAETIDSFSLFLKELKDELGKKKILSCTIEARTPPSSLYRDIPVNIQYANDYKAIGKYCDRVQIMAYDQGRADILLNAARVGAPYAPVADKDWVKKVLELALQSIPAEKIMLAVPTYGYEYEITVLPDWFQGYQRLWSLNPGYALDTAREYKITPSRDRAGEMSFSYFATSSPFSILKILPVPEGTPSGGVAAAQALLFATATGMNVPVNSVMWSDAGAVKEKKELAESLGLRGISIFKIDGGEDEDIWDLF